MQVYNINSGHNAEILEKSRTLGGYSAFVGKVREYAQSFTQEEAMKKALKYCMDNDILKTFFETHSSEVFNMLLTEWDTEEAKAVWREEGFEDGLEEGMGIGMEKGMEKGMGKGREERDIEIIRNALAKGFSIETVQELTGIDIKFIQSIQAERI